MNHWRSTTTLLFLFLILSFGCEAAAQDTIDDDSTLRDATEESTGGSHDDTSSASTGDPPGDPAVSDGPAASENTSAIPPTPSRLPEGIVTFSFGALVILFVLRARRGHEYFIRKIPGLEAIDEAIGRATEMGRPILYCPGLDGLDEVATVASMNILGQVSKRVAEYETPLKVPNRDPIVMTVSQEIVREAYNAAGRPDLYNEADIYYVTDSQFGYAAAVCGTMIRERPATNLFFGRFYAESLVLAETGNMTGAIQIAGTDSDAQIPFFITACDYTLIGEELYAGSAYLSKEPLLAGTIRAQDIAKIVLLILLIAGSILSFAGVFDLRPFLGKWDVP